MWVMEQRTPVTPLAPVCPVNPVRPAERAGMRVPSVGAEQVWKQVQVWVKKSKHTCEAAGARLSGQPCEACRERVALRMFFVSI